MIDPRILELLPKFKKYPMGHIQPTCNCRGCVRIDGVNNTIDEVITALSKAEVAVVPCDDDIRLFLERQWVRSDIHPNDFSSQAKALRKMLLSGGKE